MPWNLVHGNLLLQCQAKLFRVSLLTRFQYHCGRDVLSPVRVGHAHDVRLLDVVEKLVHVALRGAAREGELDLDDALDAWTARGRVAPEVVGKAGGLDAADARELAEKLNPVIGFYDPLGLSSANFWEKGNDFTCARASTALRR